MKLKAQKSTPVEALYSMAFWWFRISPLLRLGGELGGGGREEEGRGERM